MGDDNKYYWIKLRTNFFSFDEIDFLLSQENGCQYVVLYQMLCLMSANNNGDLSANMGDILVPYDTKKIVRETKHFDFDTVTVALELFKKLGLVYLQENNVLKVANIQTMIGSESASKEAIKKREYRARKMLVDNQRDKLGTKCPTEIDIDIEKEIEKEIDIDIEKDNTHSRIDYNGIINAYNELCPSLPKVKTLSDSRKRAIKSIVKKYGVEQIKEAFKMVEQSDFLTGKKDGSTWNANFDWIMKDSNMAKILDGNYEQQDKKPDNPWMHDERLQGLFK